MAADRVDILIVGAGPVGACAAALLARATGLPRPLRVVILEPAPPPSMAETIPLDSRVVALSRSSERILNAAGAWSRIAGRRVCAYQRIRVWHERVAPQSSDAVVFDAAEIGEPNLGYIAESRLLQTALLESFATAGGRLEAVPFDTLRVGPEGVQVQIAGRVLNAQLVIGADGAQSRVRRSIGITAETTDFHQTAIVATVATSGSHENTAWQRFMRNGTLAFLPLADGSSSIVWSVDNRDAASLIAATPVEFAAALDRAADHALGTTRLLSQRSTFPLFALSAHRYVTRRCALLGDAAHVVHPLAGQGVNLGLLDAASLAQLVTDACREREDPGALRVLRPYERWRKTETAVMSTAIQAFDRLLAHGTGPVARIAQRGLGWVNRSQEIKGVFIRRALGTSGELPRAAR